jgi:hypothetical protein
MRMRAFSPGPVCGRQEQETQQRHPPEEKDPGCRAKLAESTWHGLTRCFPMVEVIAREHFDNRGRIDSRT